MSLSTITGALSTPINYVIGKSMPNSRAPYIVLILYSMCFVFPCASTDLMHVELFIISYIVSMVLVSYIH